RLRREWCTGDLVHVPPLQRPAGLGVGSVQQGRTRRPTPRRGPGMGRRDPAALPHLPQGAQAVAQRRHRALHRPGQHGLLHAQALRRVRRGTRRHQRIQRKAPARLLQVPRRLTVPAPGRRDPIVPPPGDLPPKSPRLTGPSQRARAHMRFSREQQEFALAVREFCDAECKTLQQRDALTAGGTIANSQVILDKFAALGWLAVSLPEEYGGGGAGMVEECIFLEETSRGLAPITGYSTGLTAAQTYLRYGTEEQKRTIVSNMAAGK